MLFIIVVLNIIMLSVSILNVIMECYQSNILSVTWPYNLATASENSVGKKVLKPWAQVEGGESRNQGKHIKKLIHYWYWNGKFLSFYTCKFLKYVN
jgi:hypothetical protein